MCAACHFRLPLQRLHLRYVPRILLLHSSLECTGPIAHITLIHLIEIGIFGLDRVCVGVMGLKQDLFHTKLER